MNPSITGSRLQGKHLYRKITQRSACFLSLFCLEALLLAKLSAAPSDVVADYRFEGNLSSSVGSAPALENLGENAFRAEVVDGASRTVLHFPKGNGLALRGLNSIVSSTNYSVVMLFRFAETNSYRRLLEFRNGTEDRGLYSLDGNLYFFDVEATGTNAPIAQDQYVQVVLTRDSEWMVRCYLNGLEEISFLDLEEFAAFEPSNVLRFFQDDSTEANEHSAGSVARIRLLNRALSADEVRMLGRLEGLLDSPRLSISLSTNQNVVISWPNTSAGYGLQSIQTLSPTDFWKTITGVPASGNGQAFFTNKAEGSSGFFRLAK